LGGGDHRSSAHEKRSCCVGGDVGSPRITFLPRTMIALDFLIPTHLPSLRTALPPISGANGAAEAKGEGESS